MKPALSFKPGDIVRLTIESLGGRGDGVARLSSVPVYVPLTAPGDVADVLIGEARGEGIAGRLMTLIESGPARQAAPCPYFGAKAGECGGCALQHVAPGAYAAWKGGLVEVELARHGLGDIPVAPMQAPVPGEAGSLRRRVALAAHRLDGKMLVGFHARATRRVVPVASCLLLTPRLNRLIAPLGRLLDTVLGQGERGQAALADLDGAVDLLLASPRAPTPKLRTVLAAFAAEQGVTRISWRAYRGRFSAEVGGEDEETAPAGGAETMAQLGPCRVALAGVPVDFPPGGFLQPSRWGEAALQRLVVSGIGETKRVADLFAGLGTFSFALVGAPAGQKKRTIHAFEGDAALARALRESANRAGFSGKIVAETRNLDRRPLFAGETGSFEAVVLNPPRTGARAQCEALVEAKPTGPSRLVMVSCNPATLARDARILVDGGWQVDGVTPVDQFPYSAHVEAVAVFTRTKAVVRRGGPPGRRQ